MKREGGNSSDWAARRRLQWTSSLTLHLAVQAGQQEGEFCGQAVDTQNSAQPHGRMGAAGEVLTMLPMYRGARLLGIEQFCINNDYKSIHLPPSSLPCY